ncbi:sugar transferase [Albirhodobacter sp. R86504]|jgi:lipopolysaccharide/colanic/teichoic acid biosynthesis glycosyltransferase|uniref:sugar transferase n=1 Tax=Albirhodobacter sp. R86504 TaxID=3093848 RepID=UPI003671FB79
MRWQKRVFDLVLIAIFGLPLVLVMILVIGVLLVTQGRPLFYPAERMRGIDEPFTLWKFRTMQVVAGDSGVSGGDKAARITPAGRIMRRMRFDELPQLWNILRGDMSFVGPRPPLREYVERFPDLYAKVLRSPPGVTGLASLLYHRHEERILSACETAEQTDDAYCNRCIPMKAKLDLIYQSRASVCWDGAIVYTTLARVLGR